MSKEEVWVEVPGKIMLGGEYSILHTFEALAFTINKYLRLKVQKKSSGGLCFHSNIWENSKNANISDLETGLEPFVQMGLYFAKKYNLPHLQFTVASEFKISDGVGSSSAICLASAFATYLLATGENPNLQKKWEITKEALDLQKKAQKKASGYDFATQLLGGCIFFTAPSINWPHGLYSLEHSESEEIFPFVHIIGGGTGQPTASIVTTSLQILENKGRLSHLSTLANSFISLLKKGTLAQDEESFFATCGKYRRFFYELNTVPNKIRNALDFLPGLDKNWSYKTTGAGGEDVILLFGKEENVTSAILELKNLGWEKKDFQFAKFGLRYKM